MIEIVQVRPRPGGAVDQKPPSTLPFELIPNGVANPTLEMNNNFEKCRRPANTS